MPRETQTGTTEGAKNEAIEFAKRVGFLPGFLAPSAGANAPDGWYVCDGSAKSRVDDKPLFDAIGTVWGAGDGSTTFNIPDLRGRTVIGVGTGDYTGATDRALGAEVGSETHQLTEAQMPNHNHGIPNSNPHNHATFGDQGASANSGSFNRVVRLRDTSGGGTNGTTGDAGVHDHGGTTNNRGSDNGHPNMQPSAAVNMLIKR